MAIEAVSLSSYCEAPASFATAKANCAQVSHPAASEAPRAIRILVFLSSAPSP
jgi:hypothetical protein